MRIALVVSRSWFTSKTFGGAEKQIYYIATAMAKASHPVDLYTMDIDKPFCKEGVNILPAWNPNIGIKKVRYLTYRIPELKRKLIAGHYDIVYFRGKSLFSSCLIYALKNTSIITVIGIASDSNISWKMWKQSFQKRDKKNDCFNYIILKCFQNCAVRKAKIVFTQNSMQSKLAKKLSENVHYCPNIYRDLSQQTNTNSNIVESDIIWIGGLRQEKGLDDLFEVIDLLPNVKFTIIGKTTGKKQLTFENNFAQHENVTYITHIPNNRIHLYLQASKLLLNTSPHEGFSNTFLEAWYNKLPVVALYSNPSNLLVNYGYCGDGDISLLIVKINHFLVDKQLRTSIGNKAREYVVNEHNEEDIVKLFEEIV